MLARCGAAALLGLEAHPVVVEVDLAPGLPGFQLVGLSDASGRDARERVRSALRNSGFRLPQSRVVVSLAPADLPKQGASFDLAIALAVLVASGQLDPARLQALGPLVSCASMALCGPLRGFWLWCWRRSRRLPQG